MSLMAATQTDSQALPGVLASMTEHGQSEKFSAKSDI
jgi:hypothetical protein